MSTCDTCWGGHACDLASGHFGVHECNYGSSSPCSQYDHLSRRARYTVVNDVGPHVWTEWMERGA